VPIEPVHGGVYDTDCDRAYRCIDRFANKPGEAELVCFAETTALRTASGPVDDQGEGANATNYLRHLMKLAPRTTRTTSETVKSKVVSATFETGAGRDNEPIAHEICLRLRKQALDHENKHCAICTDSAMTYRGVTTRHLVPPCVSFRFGWVRRSSVTKRYLYSWQCAPT
jgi:hypothetical protein